MNAGRFLSSPLPYAMLAALLIGIFIYRSVDVRQGDSRPLGDVDEIVELAQRDDVNVLFVLIDTLRADRLGAYGYDRETSPLIDHLSRSGVRFSKHLAQASWTKASMASMWTGLYPNRTGVTRFNHVLSPEAIMPAEQLREAGFRTAAIWRNGWVSGYFGFDQGFEVYNRPVSRPPPPEVRRQNPTLSLAGTDMDAIIAAQDFIRVYGKDRWFLYLHLMDVHEYLYDEDTAVFGSSYSDIYDNAILRTNHELLELYSFLADMGQLERTLVVITSDHGEAFSERGFEGHARKVYRESTEVPFIISFPFKLKSELAIDARTRGIDVWPTILDLLDIEFNDDIDGRSQVPEILAAAAGEPNDRESNDIALAHLDQTWGQRTAPARPTVAVVDGPLRYVQSLEPSGQLREELFDASMDVSESIDVLASRAEESARLRRLAEDYLDSEPPWGTEDLELEIDEIQLNQLRALGYQIP